MKFYDDEDDNIPAPRRKKQATTSAAAKVEEDPDELRRQELNMQQEHLRYAVKTGPRRYDNYMNMVRDGERPVPFLHEPWAKKTMLKCYRRYVYYFVSKAWIALHPELELDLPTTYVEGYERVVKLNEELVASLKVISSMPKKVITRVRNRDNMFIIKKAMFNPFLTRFVAVVGELEISCVVPECKWHDDVMNIAVLEKPLDDADCEPTDEDKVDMPPAVIDQEKQIIPLCSVHKDFFELIFVLLKMDYNVKKNMETWMNTLREKGQITDDMKTCEDVCKAIPIPSLKGIVVHYLSIYLKLFAFGTTEDWKVHPNSRIGAIRFAKLGEEDSNEEPKQDVVPKEENEDITEE